MACAAAFAGEAANSLFFSVSRFFRPRVDILHVKTKKAKKIKKENGKEAKKDTLNSFVFFHLPGWAYCRQGTCQGPKGMCYRRADTIRKRSPGRQDR